MHIITNINTILTIINYARMKIFKKKSIVKCFTSLDFLDIFFSLLGKVIAPELLSY